jgi:hypothetical protein
LAILLAPVVVATVGCGRIPPLYDAEMYALPADDLGARRGDGSLASADAALDARGPSDAAVGSGGAAGNPGTGGASRTGGAGGAPGTTSSCTGVVAAVAARRPADVLLVLDRSGSMNYSIAEECSCDPLSNPKVVCADTVNCTTRWASLVDALTSTLASTPFLHWGLKLFSSPGAGACEVSDGVEVPLGPDTAAAIEAQMAATTTAGETPTAAAIAAATAYLATLTDANGKLILLATDGKPNCGGEQPSVYEVDVTGTIDAITAAVKTGFLVYVVGLGTGATLGNLDTFAQAGGTGSHYPAQSPEELARAVAAISKAATCTFALATTPLDANWVTVYLDNQAVPQDASNGWSFGATLQTVLLHGSYCDQALAAASGTVQVLFGCGPSLPRTLP